MTLALVAGQGRLPMLLLETLRAQGEDVVLCELDGFPVEDRQGEDVIGFRIERLGSFLKTLKRRGVTRVCFGGAIRRPALDASRLDAATLPLLPKLMAALGKGDDGALRIALGIFEDAGLRVVGATDLLPDLLPRAGQLSRHAPDKTAQKDAARGAQVVAALGAVDVGQGCVVARGQVLAVEAAPGTAWMLASLAAARDGVPRQSLAQTTRSGDPFSWALDQAVDYLAGEGAAGPLYVERLPEGGLFYKAAKPGQDRRIDLPAIGPDTVTQCAEAGLAGIVIEAGGVMVLDLPQVRELADAHGLFLWVRAAAP